MNCCVVPPLVWPSPMKKGCFSAGDSDVKSRLDGEEKLSIAGADEELGVLSSRKTPTSELMGAAILDMPFSLPAKFCTMVLASPSGPVDGPLGSFAPVPLMELNVRIMPLES